MRRARGGAVANPEGWVFRIAHNAAQDFLRRRARQEATRSGRMSDMIAGQQARLDRQIARQPRGPSCAFRSPSAALSSCAMCSAILFEEIGDILGISIPAVKGTLQRGRTHLRELAEEPDDVPAPRLDEAERSLWPLISTASTRATSTPSATCSPTSTARARQPRCALNGRQAVGHYYHRYALKRRSTGAAYARLRGRGAAILMFDPEDPAGPPGHFFIL